jgi:hypothetical protein
MVYALHKFKHFLLGNKFVFYVDHMVQVYLVNKSQVSRRIARWWLLLLECEFTVLYKLGRTHVVANVLSIWPDSLVPLGVSYQTMDSKIFFIKHIWMQKVKTYLEMGQMSKTLNLALK